MPIMITLPTIPSIQNTQSAKTIPDLPLQDIVTPESISAWPPAPGWYLLALLFMLFAAVTLFYFRRYRNKWLYRHEAMQQIHRTIEAWQAGQVSKENTVQALLQTLKQTAISAYPQQAIEGVYGEAWLNLLIRQAPSITINDEIKKLIVYGQYQNVIDDDPEQLTLFCLKWIKKHHYEWLSPLSNKSDEVNNASI